MVNLIGQAPDLAHLLTIPTARVHLYGKEPKAGRKVGHVTVVGPTMDAIAADVAAVEALARG
jgi:5-(carboxyamino)imidazole ribonucleotide synthase